MFTRLNIDKLLTLASKNCNYNIVKTLIKRGGNPNLLIKKAIKTNDIKLTRFLINNGAYVQPSLLFKVIKNDNYDMAKLLLKSTSEINYDYFLKLVIKNNNHRLFKLLLYYKSSTPYTYFEVIDGKILPKCSL